MHRSLPPLIRMLSVAMALAILLAGLPPGPARAEVERPNDTVFQAEFDSAPAGPLSDALPVEVGTVIPEGGGVAIAGSGSGQALSVGGSGGQSAALLQWFYYPDGLPVRASREQRLHIWADFSSFVGDPTNISVGLLAGADFFEFFSFGPSGSLKRHGVLVGKASDLAQPLRMHVEIRLRSGRATGRVSLYGPAMGSAVMVDFTMPAAFSPDRLNQMRIQAASGSAAVLVDHVQAELRHGESREEELPPEIIIGDGDIEQEVELIDGAIFVSIKIMIVNRGHRVTGCFLALNLDDFRELFDLADVSFLEDSGFVSYRDEHEVVIGLGRYNVIDADGRVKVKIKFKAKQNRLDIKISARMNLRIGRYTVNVPPVVVAVAPPAPGQTDGDDVIAPTPIVRLPVSRIDARFQAAWERRGGLLIFGLPLGDAYALPSGVVVQYFERARLEWHPQERAVMLGRLAVELGYARPPAPPPASAAERRWYYPATGHLIAGPFRSFWQSRGGLALLGLPIAESATQDGRLIQYFERARLEQHQELRGTRYEIQIGHLGVELLSSGR